MALSTENSNPEVTVFIPTYNRLNFLKKAVASVLNCGMDVNLHVLNNCSSDGTHEWLDEFLTKSTTSVTVTHQRENVGSIANYECGFKSVKTKYVVPLADDDELVPGFLSIALEKANRHPEVVAVIGSVAVRKKNGWKTMWNSARATGFIGPGLHIREFFNYGHHVSWSAILWRASEVQQNDLMGKAKAFGLFSDVYFQFEAFLYWPVYVEPLPAATFAIREGQESSKIGLSVASFKDFANLAETMIRELLESSLDIDPSTARECISLSAVQLAEFIKSNREQALKTGLEINSEECLKSYIHTIFPFAGMVHFPFQKEIEACNAAFMKTKKQKKKRKSLLGRIMRKFKS